MGLWWTVGHGTVVDCWTRDCDGLLDTELWWTVGHGLCWTVRHETLWTGGLWTVVDCWIVDTGLRWTVGLVTDMGWS